MSTRILRWGILVSVLSAADLRAGLLPTNVSKTTEGSDQRFSYSVQLQSGSVLKPGDFFTIYDFAGLIDGSNLQPAGFTFSSSNSGLTPGSVIPSDDGGLANLTWTYSGSDTLGPADLGSFSALSSYSETTDDSFTGQSHRSVDGRLNNNITDTKVPVPVAPDSVPEPSSLLLLAAGLPLMLGLKRLRSR